MCGMQTKFEGTGDDQGGKMIRNTQSGRANVLSSGFTGSRSVRILRQNCSKSARYHRSITYDPRDDPMTRYPRIKGDPRHILTLIVYCIDNFSPRTNPRLPFPSSSAFLCARSIGSRTRSTAHRRKSGSKPSGQVSHHMVSKGLTKRGRTSTISVSQLPVFAQL